MPRSREESSASSHTNIIAHSLKNQLPNSSHNNYAHSTTGLEQNCRRGFSGHSHGSYGYAGHVHGYGSYGHHECGGGNRSRLLVILKWCSAILTKIVNAYLSSPMLMAIVPLLAGMGIGFFISLYYRRGALLRSGGRRRRRRKEANHVQEHGKKTRDTSSSSSWPMVTFAVVAFRSFLPSPNWFGYRFDPNIVPSTIHDDEYEEEDHNEKEHIMEYEYEKREKQGSEIEDEHERDEHTRNYLKSGAHTDRESGLDSSEVPKHIAVIMDGNRRYGKTKYGSVSKGHWDGSKTLLDFTKWCLAEGVQIITVYAFSTENWNRSASEVSALMGIFCKYCEELREEAMARGIRIKVLSTETERIPSDVAEGIQRMVEDTKHGDNLTLNICLSYGSQGEILNACKAIAHDVRDGIMNPSDITNSSFENKLLTGGCPNPDLIIRTSGEFRLSNFMLWQLAYSEMYFLEKQWPALTKNDLLGVLKDYANNRQRRFGK